VELPFLLRYTVHLQDTNLEVKLEVKNTGDESFWFTTCLHTYFRTPDIRNCAIVGLQGTEFIDKVDGFKKKKDTANELHVPTESVASKGFVDRIYKASPSTVVLQDRGIGTRFTVTHTKSYIDTVVFNPWEEGKKGDKGPDFDDDGYNYMVCIEAAVVNSPACVGPRETWEGMQSINAFLQPPDSPKDAIPDLPADDSSKKKGFFSFLNCCTAR